ncbi:MAG: hypothetical protein KA138_14510 [Saprospiraceae bacterium]|nr:hypothetical protein [Saprospiraceae bacterium]
MESFETTAQPQIWRSAGTETANIHVPSTSQQDTKAEEMVDFCTTESVEKSLKGAIWWSWVVVGCVILFLILEIVAICSALLLASQRGIGFNAIIASTLVKQIVYFSISGLIIWHGAQFGIQMRKAIQHRDNPALSLAFFHQSQYFKWAFIQIIAAVVLSLITPFL